MELITINQAAKQLKASKLLVIRNIHVGRIRLGMKGNQTLLVEEDVKKLNKQQDWRSFFKSI